MTRTAINTYAHFGYRIERVPDPNGNGHFWTVWAPGRTTDGEAVHGPDDSASSLNKARESIARMRKVKR